MNIEQVNEALARLDRTKAANLYRPDIEPVIDAARRFVAGWETCPTCNGSGTYIKEYDQGYDTPLRVTKPCSDCVDGMIPGPEQRVRVAKAIAKALDKDVEMWDQAQPFIIDAWLKVADAVLLASRREEQ